MPEYEQQLYGFIDLVVKQGASDLHLSAGRMPTLRIDGRLVPIGSSRVLTPQDMEAFLGVMAPAEKQEVLKKDKAADFSYTYQDKARFRVNAYYQFGSLAIAMRFIPVQIRSIEELMLPQILHTFTEYQQGFVLITGPAGHGKSTTLAALIQEINQERTEHIITIEDPIEYIFTPERSIIDQREVGSDTLGFEEALRESFRQDPDIIMLGEMRDGETISTAISAAETGHLVFATLHTNNAAQTIDRILDSFPPAQQAQVRAQLALTLVGVVSQRLVPRLQGGRIPAIEVLISNPAVRNLIREGKVHELGMVIDTNRDEGMVSMNRSLANLVRQGEISAEVAESYSLNDGELQALIRR